MCRMQKKEEGMNMKEEAIKKINKIGKVSSVFALIGKIMVGLGMVALLISAVFCFFAPKELMTINVDEKVGFLFDVGFSGVGMTDEEIKEAEQEITQSFAEEEDVQVEDVVVTDDTMQFSMMIPTCSFTMRDLGWLMIVLLVNVTMVMVTLCFIAALCKAFRDCVSPFEENVVKKMSNLAYSLIPWALLSTVTNSIANSLLQNKISVNLTVDLGVIMIVLVVFVMVHIFRYGAMLQQESDETL